MVSRSRWWVPLLLVGCNDGVAAGRGTAVPRGGVIAICEDPTLEDAVSCDAPETQDPATESSIDPALPGTPNLRVVAALVRPTPDQVVVVGTYGDATADGTFAVAIDAAAVRVWSAAIPSGSEVTAVAASADAEGVWIATAHDDGDTVVQRYDLTGAMVAEAIVADFAVESLQAQPLNAVALSGTSGGTPAYVGVAVDGTELWNGDDNLAEGPRVVAQGSAQYFDGPGAAVWEIDPRGTPDEGFPIDIGLERAIITSTGDVLAIGQVHGPLGNNALLVRMTAAGKQTWSHGIPRAHAEVVLEGADDTEIIVGPSFHCTPGTYLAVFDADAVILQSVRVAAPPSPWIAGVDGDVISVAADGDALMLRSFEVET